MLTMQVQNHPHVTVLLCSGRIVRGDGADTLLQAVMSQDKCHIQIDLGQVDTIDASGLGTLAALEKWALDENRTIQLTNPSKLVREAIDTTNLSSVLQMSPTLEERDDAA